MKSWTKPTTELIDRALASAVDYEQRRYLFSRLENPLWAKPLAERDCFRNPPAPKEIGNGYIQFPPWPESQYLARVAKGAPKDVIEMPTISNGMAEKTPHPTQKPEELLRKLLTATTKPNDLVIDPFSGSGTTAVTAEQLGRSWSTCDLSEQYNRWASDRLSRVKIKNEDHWLEQDRRLAQRRESIR